MNSILDSGPLCLWQCFITKCGIPHDIDFVRPELKICANKRPRAILLCHRNLYTRTEFIVFFELQTSKGREEAPLLNSIVFFLALSFLSNFPKKWMALLSNFPAWLSVHFQKRNLNGKN